MSVARLYCQVRKVSLSTPRRRRRGVTVQIHPVLTSAALRPLSIHLEAERFDQEKKLLTLLGFELQLIQLENLVTLKTELSWLSSSLISYNSNKSFP
jgi:hypothetical protein